MKNMTKCRLTTWRVDYMTSIQRIIDLSQIRDLITKKTVFVGCVSFEERSISAINYLECDSVEKAYVFYCSQFLDNNGVGERLEMLKSTLCNCLETNAFSIDKPIDTVRLINMVISKIVDKGTRELVIDVTTFTHELLLMITKAVYEHRSGFESIRFLYVSADDYSVGDAPQNKWLSKGCHDVRNVIGYLGNMRPTAKTCLVLLVGFEHERAAKLIEFLEPECIELGNGIDSTNDNHIPTINHFKTEFDKLFSGLSCSRKSKFDFSCKDIVTAAKGIMGTVRRNMHSNIIIVPLNTKLSTISTALVALKYPDIQVAYAVTEAYNTEKYSIPGDKVTVIDMKKLFDCNFE